MSLEAPTGSMGISPPLAVQKTYAVKLLTYRGLSAPTQTGGAAANYAYAAIWESFPSCRLTVIPGLIPVFKQLSISPWRTAHSVDTYKPVQHISCLTEFSRRSLVAACAWLPLLQIPDVVAEMLAKLFLLQGTTPRMALSKLKNVRV